MCLIYEGGSNGGWSNRRKILDSAKQRAQFIIDMALPSVRCVYRTELILGD